MSAPILNVKSQEPLSSSVDLINVLPPNITTNTHQLIEPEQICQSDIGIRKKRRGLRVYRSSCRYIQPVAPQYPIILQCIPEPVCIELDDTPVLKRLRIVNIGTKLTSFHVSGLKGDIAHLGAHWWYSPRTNFLLAPGIGATVFIEVTPKYAPLPHATAVLQLAAGLKRDNAVSNINVDVNVEFLQYSKRFNNSPVDSPKKMVKE